VIQVVLRRLPKRRTVIPVWLAVTGPWILACAGALIISAASRAARATADVAYTFLGLGEPSSVDAVDTNIRSTEAAELFRGWANHPIFGSGLGAELPSGYVRSLIRPWMFELQYHQALFALGLFGMLLLGLAALLVLWTIIAAGRAVYRPSLVAATTAGIAIVVANASNPYLQAVGHGWGVALAVGIANVLLIMADDLPSTSKSSIAEVPVTRQGG
jgi:hypothetical protein